MYNMNLLEQEDFVKGWPDTKLLEYMKNPDGTVNYAVAGAEVSFRNKQRKNFAENQSKLPENTVLEKELNQFEKGIMSLPQQQPVFPPPQIDQIPKGPGILDDPNSPINMSPEQFDQRFRNPDILPPGNPDDPIRMNEGGMIPYYTPEYSPESYQERQRFEESIFSPNSPFEHFVGQPNIAGFDRDRLFPMFNVKEKSGDKLFSKERTTGTYDIPGYLSEDLYKKMLLERPESLDQIITGMEKYGIMGDPDNPTPKEYQQEIFQERSNRLKNGEEYVKTRKIPTDSAGATLQDSPQIPEFMQPGRTSTDKSVSGYIEGQSATTRGMVDNIISNFSETYEPDYSFSSELEESFNRNIDGLTDLQQQLTIADESRINDLGGLLEKLTQDKTQAAEKRSSARESYLESEKNRKFGIEDLIAEASARKVDFSEQEAQQRKSTDAGIASLLAAAFAAPTQDQRARILTGITGLYQDEADRLTDLSREQQLLNMGYEDEARQMALRAREMEYDRAGNLADLGFDFEMAAINEEQEFNELIHGFKVEISNANTEAHKQAIRNKIQLTGIINENEIRIAEAQKEQEDQAFERGMRIIGMNANMEDAQFRKTMALLNFRRGESAEFDRKFNTIMQAHAVLYDRADMSDDAETIMTLKQLEAQIMQLVKTMISDGR